MRLLLPLIAALALSACEAPRDRLDRSGRGDPARLTYVPAGTEIVLKNTANGAVSETRITAEASDGLRGAYRAEDGRIGSFYPGCWGCGTGMTIQDELYAQLWPLETGKSVAFVRTNSAGEKARVLITVAGTQTVTTEAGTFDTYMLDGRVEHLTGPRYSAQVRAWWAPDPGWVVKAEGGDSQGSTLSSEAVAFTFP